MPSLVGSEMCIRDRGGAVPVHGHARDVEPRQNRDHTADVVALLSSGQPAAADEVFDVRVVELWDLLENLCDNVSGQVVGCLLYTSDAADDLLCVDLGGRR